MSDYPTLMFRCPGPHFAHDGQTYEYIPVRDEAELIDRLNNGWSVTLLEAVAAVTHKHELEHDGDEDAAPTRAELENKAKELGIKFDGRTSDASLLKKIEDKLEG